MINKSNLNGLWAVLAGMIIFKGTGHIATLEGYFQQYPLVFIGAGFLLFFQREKLTGVFLKNG